MLIPNTYKVLHFRKCQVAFSNLPPLQQKRIIVGTWFLACIPTRWLLLGLSRRFWIFAPPSRVRGVSRGTLGGGDKNEQNFFPNFSIFSIGLVSLGCLHLRISIHDATTPVLDHFLLLWIRSWSSILSFFSIYRLTSDLKPLPNWI